MKNLSLSVLAGILFSAIGTASLFITKDALMAAIWMSFGNGLILANLQFKKQDAKGNVAAAPVPKVRYYAGMALLALAVLLLGLQIYNDLAV